MCHIVKIELNVGLGEAQMSIARWIAVTVLPTLFLSFAFAQRLRDPAQDREAIIALEQEWLHASDADTLDRLLASDFVHVVPVDHFLTKQEHIDWVVKHPEPKDRHTKFDNLQVRLYGDAGIVNGSVIAS